MRFWKRLRRIDPSNAMPGVVSGGRRWVSLLLAVTLVVAACGGSGGSVSFDESESDDSGGNGSEPSEPSGPMGTGILTVAGVDYAFEVSTCNLDGYENEGVEFDFDVAGAGSNEGRTYHVFARRSYHPDDDWWIEVIDLDYQDGGEGLHTLHGFSAAESEPFIFMLNPAGVDVEDPVAFVSDLVDETPAGEGTIVIDCPTSAVATPPASTTATTIPPATTTVPLVSTTAPPTTSTTEPATTSTTAAGPEAACRSFATGLNDLLAAAAAQLRSGATVTTDIDTGAVSVSEGAELLSDIAQELSDLLDELGALGDAPPQMASAAQLLADSFDLFQSAYDSQARGTAASDGALIDEGDDLLNQGAALLGEYSEAMGDCAATDTTAAPATLATPDETALTIFHTVVETLLRGGAYEGLDPDVLNEGSQAACLVLLAGGDIRTAIESALAATPADGQPLGNAEQNLVLMLVTRGVPLWCPDVIDDEEAFNSEVRSTIVDIFFEG